MTAAQADQTHRVLKPEPQQGQRSFLSLTCLCLGPAHCNHVGSHGKPSVAFSHHGSLNPKPGWHLPSQGKIGPTALQTGPADMKPVAPGSVLTQMNTSYFQDHLCWAVADAEIF